MPVVGVFTDHYHPPTHHLLPVWSEKESGDIYILDNAHEQIIHHIPGGKIRQMRVVTIAIVLTGLALLLVHFFFDIFTQSPQTTLGPFNYYIPALLSIVFIVWSLVLFGTMRTNGKKNKYLKALTIGLLLYALGWQFIYLKFILTKNFSGGLTDHLTNSFPIIIAIGCSLKLLSIKIKELRAQ
jgi:heme/copper-type cytochrome/quinol oxidase subunit 2